MTIRPIRDELHALAFLSPFLAVNAIFLVYPFLLGIWMSLHDWDLMRGRAQAWRGVGNYARMLSDPLFWRSLLHTVEFSLLAVPAITVVALLLALALNSPLRRHAALRAVFFGSGVFSVTVVTLVWLTVLNPSRGLVGLGARLLGVAPIDLLADRRFALPSLVVTTVWWSVGLPMAIFIAGLQGIPGELYEAAELDHAGPVRTLLKVTLPSLRRTVWIVVLLQIVAQFQIFGQVLLMTRGGPAYSTHMLVQLIYEAGFREWEVGYATTLSFFLFTVMLAISLLQLRASRREVG